MSMPLSSFPAQKLMFYTLSSGAHVQCQAWEIEYANTTKKLFLRLLINSLNVMELENSLKKTRRRRN